jgi:hypothetical protein
MLEQVKLAKKNTIQGKINTNWRVYKKKLKVTPPTVGFVSLRSEYNISGLDWIRHLSGAPEIILNPFLHSPLVVLNKFSTSAKIIYIYEQIGTDYCRTHPPPPPTT